MENPLKKLKKSKEEKPETDEKEKQEKVDAEKEDSRTTDRRSYSNERRKAFREKPIQDDNMSKPDIILQHLMETELKVIQKKAKALYLDTEDNFSEKAEENYWKVSVNEFLSYVNQRSQIIIQQLSGESKAVEVELLGADEEGGEE